MNYSLNALYDVAGKSKQAVWAHFKAQQKQLDLVEQLIGQVDARREHHPGCGLEKLYYKLAPEGIGRDKFCKLFMKLGYGLKPAKQSVRTTFPAHKVFSNLIEGQLLWRPNQVWQSDITYIKVAGRFFYLIFIIDGYTRRIVGYAVSRDLRAEANRRALKKALSAYDKDAFSELIHHSDRGSQYIDGRYLSLLRTYNISISMGKIATENAFAERINGTIKNEYLLPKRPESYRQLKKLTHKAVIDYNTVRPHRSLQMQTPRQFECSWSQLAPRERVVEMIRSEQTPPVSQESLDQVNSDKFNPQCLLP